MRGLSLQELLTLMIFQSAKYPPPSTYDEAEGRGYTSYHLLMNLPKVEAHILLSVSWSLVVFHLSSIPSLHVVVNASSYPAFRSSEYVMQSWLWTAFLPKVSKKPASVRSFGVLEAGMVT